MWTAPQCSRGNEGNGADLSGHKDGEKYSSGQQRNPGGGRRGHNASGRRKRSRDAPGGQRTQRYIPEPGGERRQKDQKDTSDGFRRTFQRGYGAAAQRSDAETGPETSKLEHGKEDNHRFGDHDE